jgi:hypothetical protein
MISKDMPSLSASAATAVASNVASGGVARQPTPTPQPLQPISQSAELNRPTPSDRSLASTPTPGAQPTSGQSSGKQSVDAQPANQTPQQQQKKKKLSFRQRLSRCGSGCKIKISKKNSNEMEMDSTQNENAQPSQPSTPIAVAAAGQVGDLVKGDTSDIGSEHANAHLGHKLGTDAIHQGHCARNFFCWCCCCCSCTK